MIFIHGVYHFKPTRVAFRNDYCLTCEAPRRSVQVRTLDVIHLYGIPLVPLGFWKRWRCGTCHARPHVNRKIRRPFQWLGAIACTTLSLIVWLEPPPNDFVVGAWLVRLLCPAGAFLLFRYIATKPTDRSLTQKLATIEASTDTMCPFCATPMMVGAGVFCPLCNVRRV
jgi:hypothetical protein